MKKAWVALLVVTSVIFMKGCRVKELELTPGLINANIVVFEADEIHAIDDIEQHDLGDWTILSTAGFSTAGFLVVRNVALERGVFSVALGEMLVDFSPDIDDITVSVDGVFGAYAVVWYDNDEIAIVDAAGNAALARGEYEVVGISGEIVGSEDETIYLEHIDTRSDGVWTTTTYRVDTVSGTRTVHEEAVEYETGDFFGEAKLSGTDLEPFGLEGHYYTVSNELVRVFEDEDNRQIASFVRPDVITRMIFDGVMLYQVNRLVQRDDDKHTYTDNAGDSYFMETFAIDFKTGKTSELKVDFFIDDFDVFLDEEGIARYVVVQAQKINDKFLIDEIVYTYIINAKGQVVRDITGINFDFLMRLSETRIIDLASGTIMDNNLEPLLDAAGVLDYFASVEMLLAEHNGMRGLVDLDGYVTVPFEYDDIWDAFYEGKTIAEDGAGNFWVIDLDDGKTAIPHGDIRPLTNGIYLSHEDFDPVASEKVFYIRDYAGAALETIVIEIDDVRYNEHRIDTPILQAFVLRLHSVGIWVDADNYIYIGVTYED